MAYLENATTIEPNIGDTYLRGMKDQKEKEFDAIIDELMKEQLPPYTMEEIYAMIDEAQRDFKAGRFYTTEEVFQEIDEESLEPYTQEELLEMAETGRQQIAEGKCFTTEEVLLHCLTCRSHHKSL